MARRSLLEHLATLPDPRIDRTKKHRLDDILLLTLIGLIGGATTFETIHAFAQCRKSWLQTFLKLPHGIPSHDTIYRVFCALDAKVFAASFGQWAAEWLPATGLTHIAIDGKSLRGTQAETFSGCVHLVSAWATEAGLLLGQEAVAEKSNEIAAIPRLLETLHLQGALVTIDAAGCQKSIVEAIRDKKGHYLLSVKGNQEKLHAALEAAFATAIAKGFEGLAVSQHESRDEQHGRREERYVTVLENPQGLPEGWRDVVSIIQVNREREVKGVNTSTTQYYMSSLSGTAEQMGQWIRRHWAIENELHWVLDVIMEEDRNATRDRNASANLGVVRRLALALLQRAPGKQSKPVKIVKAAGDTSYLKSVLQEISAI